jgi:SAM-dependent methyltransferase
VGAREPPFDAAADRYEEDVERAIAFAGRSHRFYTEAKVQELVELMTRWLGSAAGVAALDVGCGPGLTDELLLPHIRSLHGLDVSRALLARAEERNPGARYEWYDGGRFPLDDSSFDLTFAVCVLHHVGQGDRPSFAQELARVTRPGGLVVVFEHNALNPLTRRAVRACSFDRDAELLRVPETTGLLEDARLEVLERRFVLFFPWRGAAWRRAERRLRRLPLGAQYAVVGRR